MGRSLGYMVFHFGEGCNTLRGVQWSNKSDGSVFQHICDSLKGTLHSLI